MRSKRTEVAEHLHRLVFFSSILFKITPLESCQEYLSSEEEKENNSPFSQRQIDIHIQSTALHVLFDRFDRSYYVCFEKNKTRRRRTKIEEKQQWCHEYIQTRMIDHDVWNNNKDTSIDLPL